MKLYWPVALACSAVGCIILMPIACRVPAPQIFIGVEHIGYALASGGVMGLLTRRLFERATWPVTILFAGLLGLLHVAIFGALVGMVRGGPKEMLVEAFEAPVLSLQAFWAFLPLAVGACAAIRWAATQEVDNVSIFD